MSAIQADYRTNKHIPSRKCYQLIMEVTEESFPEVCRTLGYPSTGENTYVGIALLEKAAIANAKSKPKTEGERLRTCAIMICKDPAFQEYIGKETSVVPYIHMWCGIESRAELATNLEAQRKFRELVDLFNGWELERTYTDNLSMV